MPPPTTTTRRMRGLPPRRQEALCRRPVAFGGAMAAEGTAAASLQAEGEPGAEGFGGFGQLLEDEEGEDSGYVLYRCGRDGMG